MAYSHLKYSDVDLSVMFCYVSTCEYRIGYGVDLVVYVVYVDCFSHCTNSTVRCSGMNWQYIISRNVRLY